MTRSRSQTRIRSGSVVEPGAEARFAIPASPRGNFAKDFAQANPAASSDRRRARHAEGQRSARRCRKFHCSTPSNKIADDSLLKIRDDLGDCTRCKLHTTRNKIVFGDGNPKAELVFVGEGPGRDEDAQGLPFVGRAGKLLTQMIEAMGLQRKDVYICNVVKCRPPENRLPEPDEIKTCSPFLLRQLDAIDSESDRVPRSVLRRKPCWKPIAAFRIFAASGWTFAAEN